MYYFICKRICDANTEEEADLNIQNNIENDNLNQLAVNIERKKTDERIKRELELANNRDIAREMERTSNQNNTLQPVQISLNQEKVEENAEGINTLGDIDKKLDESKYSEDGDNHYGDVPPMPNSVQPNNNL